MILYRQQATILHAPDEATALKLIETAGRTCYKSKPGNAKKFVIDRMAAKHDSILEHVTISMRLVTDRATSHELVRHRIASYSQESTRYVTYHELPIIIPVWIDLPEGQVWPEKLTEVIQNSQTPPKTAWWLMAMKWAEEAYLELLKFGPAEQARMVLPGSTKTELVMTANVREWRYIIQLRSSSKVHPQMRDLITKIHSQLANWSPTLFGGLVGDTQ